MKLRRSDCVIRWIWSMALASVLCLALFYYDQSYFLPSHHHENEIHHNAITSEESDFDTHLYHQMEFPFGSYSCLPQHIHLSQASNVINAAGVNMTISFDLNFKQCQNVLPPYIIYGKQNSILSLGKQRQSAGSPIHYNFTSSLTGEYFESNWIYHVTLENLTPNEQYWYQIIVPGIIHTRDNPLHQVGVNHHLFLRGLGSFGGKSPALHFHTPPNPGTPTSIALVGDIGQTLNSTKTMARIYKAATTACTKHPPISLLMIAGDLSYADSDPHRWPRWLSLMEPLLRKVPLEVAAGNHEIECDGVTGNIFVPYENLFANANRLGRAETRPINKNSTAAEWCSTPSRFLGHYNYGNSFYTFQHGLAQMIVLSSYSDTSPSSAQYRFLKQTLQEHFDRTVTPWLIVVFHCPIYTTFLGHVNEPQALRMKKFMEPLFVQYGVNLVITGHDHAYSRSKPMIYGNPDESGPVYLALGAGGNREQHSQGYRHPDEPESWIAKRSLQDYGYGHLFLSNATHAYYRWIKDYGLIKSNFTDDIWIKNQHRTQSL
mmetsp:Transcript_2668/g.3955  ORF Transcript_2668/g.3955 Transcript_2668/m.3955 type:complete len:545 (-) Transcript_2668:950-2584(-)